MQDRPLVSTEIDANRRQSAVREMMDKVFPGNFTEDANGYQITFGESGLLKTYVISHEDMAVLLWHYGIVFYNPPVVGEQKQDEVQIKRYQLFVEDIIKSAIVFLTQGKIEKEEIKKLNQQLTADLLDVQSRSRAVMDKIEGHPKKINQKGDIIIDTSFPGMVDFPLLTTSLISTDYQELLKEMVMSLSAKAPIKLLDGTYIFRFLLTSASGEESTTYRWIDLEKIALKSNLPPFLLELSNIEKLPVEHRPAYLEKEKKDYVTRVKPIAREFILSNVKEYTNKECERIIKANNLVRTSLTLFGLKTDEGFTIQLKYPNGGCTLTTSPSTHGELIVAVEKELAQGRTMSKEDVDRLITFELSCHNPSARVVPPLMNLQDVPFLGSFSDMSSAIPHLTSLLNSLGEHKPKQGTNKRGKARNKVSSPSTSLTEAELKKEVVESKQDKLLRILENEYSGKKLYNDTYLVLVHDRYRYLSGEGLAQIVSDLNDTTTDEAIHSRIKQQEMQECTKHEAEIDRILTDILKNHSQKTAAGWVIQYTFFNDMLSKAHLSLMEAVNPPAVAYDEQSLMDLRATLLKGNVTSKLVKSTLWAELKFDKVLQKKLEEITKTKSNVSVTSTTFIESSSNIVVKKSTRSVPVDPGSNKTKRLEEDKKQQTLRDSATQRKQESASVSTSSMNNQPKPPSVKPRPGIQAQPDRKTVPNPLGSPGASNVTSHLSASSLASSSHSGRADISITERSVTKNVGVSSAVSPLSSSSGSVSGKDSDSHEMSISKNSATESASVSTVTSHLSASSLASSSHSGNSEIGISDNAIGNAVIPSNDSARPLASAQAPLPASVSIVQPFSHFQKVIGPRASAPSNVQFEKYYTLF